MPRVSAAFFVTGAVFVLIGMIGGMYMGAHNDFRMVPAHAHLNLLGWVTMALYGGFYAFTAKTMSKKLAWTNYALSTIGVLLSIPALAIFLTTNNPSMIPLMSAGEGLSALSLIVFMVSAVRELLRDRTSESAAAIEPMRIAAE